MNPTSSPGLDRPGRFLFTSVPIEGHSASPLAIMARLVATGHEVVWISGAAHADRAREAGVTHVPVHLSTDYSRYRDAFDIRPEFRELQGPKLIKAVFGDVFLPDALAQVTELDGVMATFPADVIVSAGPQFGPSLVAERTGVPLAVVGDGPFAAMSDRVPPFGPGLRPWRGPAGRARNRLLNAFVRRMFGDIHRQWIAIRRELDLDGPDPWIFDVLGAADLVLQGCVPGFEYDQPFPESVRFVGALRPHVAGDWDVPEWWSELDGTTPVVHVTQGTIRANPDELIRPTIDALADEDVLVVATLGATPRASLGVLPGNVRTARFVPYDALLPRAAAFVTNGGYIGTNLALSHGVPIVQVGATEEKAEIGARVNHFGLGRAFKKLPSRRALRDAIRQALFDEGIRNRVDRLAAHYQAHGDAAEESARMIVALASRSRSRDPRHRELVAR